MNVRRTCGEDLYMRVFVPAAGYMAGRSNEATLQDAKVPGHLAAVRDYCNANPTSTIVQAFVNALRATK
jgi:hypothetical protein